MDLRERLDTLSRGELTGLVIVVVALLAGVGFWYSRSLPRPIEVSTSAGAPSVEGLPGVTPAPSASASPVPLIVDVTGWVRRPGVYEFESGQRVVDAVERAGGARPGADLALLNLAALLVDGQQIMVPKEGGSTSGAAGSIPGAPGASSGVLVNINTADAATLETLNGVGPVLAAAIVQYRTEHGQFTSVDQLDEVSGIGPSTLEELRSQVTV
jgi:competence protein ComEA